jgi:probable HAF family extracellular repeat protein
MIRMFNSLRQFFGRTRSSSPRAVKRPSLWLVVVLGCVSTTGFVRAAATFTPLGLFGGLRSRTLDVSGDGSTVVGFVDDASGASVFRHTNAATMFDRRALARDDVAVSGDGSVVVGSYLTPSFSIEAFRWPDGGDFESLGDFPGGPALPSSAAFDASADGSVIVGHGTTALGDEAFRWTQATGLVGLGYLPGGDDESVAMGVSPDGAFVVGYAGTRREAFRWTAQTGMVGLGRMPGAEWSVARSVSADGSVVVGFNSFPSTGIGSPRARAFRWTATDGMVGLSNLPPERNHSEAHDVSADGSVIVGTGVTLSQSGQELGGAFLWTAPTGMVNLQEFLVSSGVSNLNEWTLTEARGISADGLTIVGVGNHNGVTEAWVATIPEVIPEPSTIAIAGLAVAVSVTLILVRHYRRRKSAPMDTAICIASAFDGKDTPDERYRALTNRFVDPIIGAGV